MDNRRALTALGAGVTTFLLVAVLVIELLDFEFSAIIGLPVGLLAGIGAAVAVSATSLEDKPGLHSLVYGYAAFGPAVFALFGLRYVNIGRDLLSVEVMVLAGVVASLAVAVGSWASGTRKGTP